MSATYQAVQWNRQKRLYDLTLAGSVLGYLGVFIAVSLSLNPAVTAETLLLRASGTAAFLLLHLTLAIGPLARIDARWLPLLYNRRHLGVTTALLGCIHGFTSVVQHHVEGVADPLSSLLSGGHEPGRNPGLPFEVFGLCALLILIAMAASSHDFWLKLLGHGLWKALHMCVYAAYALLVAHVAFGAAQTEDGAWLLLFLSAGATFLTSVHLVAARREIRSDAAAPKQPAPWLRVCTVDEIPEAGARILQGPRERIAVFRHAGKLSAVENVCRHQGGPLGEGQIVDGCITCPWHGYQYLPEDGRAPPPFTEKLSTYRVRVDGGVVWVDPQAQPPGTWIEPARVP